MKAAMYFQYGSPEVVSIGETAKPKPGPKQVLIKIHATTVNRTDCGFRSAEYVISRFFSGLFKPKEPVLGCEFAGEIVETGPEVTTYKTGDRVFGFDDQRFGGHAQYKVMPDNGAMAIVPEQLSYEQAAPLLEGSHYALCDIRAAKVNAKHRVLVNGATGAIGSAAVQLLKHMGVEVTAVCSHEHLELVKNLGADYVVDYTKEDFTRLDQKFDLVFDAVGKSRFGKCKPLLKPKGIYISTELGPNGENPFLALFHTWSGGKRVLFPLPFINQEDVQYIQELASSGKFKPLIDRVYDLNDIVEAHRYVETGMKNGNVVIRVSHPM